MASVRTLVRSSRWDGTTPPHVDGRHTTFDLTSLVAQLILSDHVILRSSALGEIRAILQTFGLGPTIDLLASGAVSFYCHYILVSDLSQTPGFGPRSRPRPLPLFSYHFGFAEPESYVERGIDRIDAIPGLSLGEAMELKRTAVGRLATPDTALGRNALEQLGIDLTENREYVRVAVAEIFRRLGFELTGTPWRLRFAEASPHDYAVDTDVVERAGIPSERASALISSALLALGQLNVALEEMRHFGAVDEFNDDDRALIQARVSHAAELLRPGEQERRLWRVVDLHRSFRGRAVQTSAVDLPALLRFRETSECRDFRHWLVDSDDVTDEELRDRMNSLAARVGTAAATAVGRTLRWLGMTAIGLAVDPVVSVVLGAADAFLLQRLLEVPTPIVVMNRELPSILNRG